MCLLAAGIVGVSGMNQRLAYSPTLNIYRVAFYMPGKTGGYPTDS